MPRGKMRRVGIDLTPSGCQYQPPFARRSGILHPRAQPASVADPTPFLFSRHLVVRRTHNSSTSDFPPSIVHRDAVSRNDGLLGWSAAAEAAKRTSANQQQQQQRSSRRNSSSSSDILVAAPMPASPRRPLGMDDRTATMGQYLSAPVLPPRHSITARVEGGRDLVIAFNNSSALQAFADIVNTPSGADEKYTTTESAHRLPSPFDDEGPNARGTFSKAYVAKHPEISWVHRGQGRYLPATQAREIVSTPVVE